MAKKYYFINTCTIDYYLLALWWSSVHSKNVIKYFEKNSNENITKIIDNINKHQWNRAKTIWTFNVCRRQSDSNKISFFGTEYEFFSKHLAEMQRYKRLENCLTCGFDSSPREQNYLYFDEFVGKIVINIQKPKACKTCKNEMNVDFQFLNDFPCWLIIEVEYSLQLTVQELPKSLFLKDKTYKLLCATFNNNLAHFLAIFIINGEFYQVDDRNPRICDKRIPNKRINTCFYYLE